LFEVNAAPNSRCRPTDIRPYHLEWLPDPADSKIRSHPEKGCEDRWMHVRMLMRVQVRWRNAGPYYPLDLSAHFALDVLNMNGTAELSGKLNNGSRQPAVGAQQRRYFAGRRYRGTIDDRYMAANSKTRVGKCNLDGVVKCWAVRHYGRAGQDTFKVTTQYTFIRAPGETEVIPVYNQSRHLIR
jgi:hypothetical protein